MKLVWLLDRATALVAYPTLYLAVLTGVCYNTPDFGPLYRAARRVHIPIAVLATLLVLGHAALGLLDTWLVASGAVPSPSYSLSYLLAGVFVGVVALFVTLVAVLGFLDPRRFDRPWTPRVVHAFAYGGFAFATIHAVAVGTDLVSLVRPGILTAVGFLTYVLLLRLAAETGVVGTTTEGP